MTNSKLTKRSLLTSSISLLLCFAMLLGTTFAWFTDSATSAGNKIVAGNLDVDLLMAGADGAYSSIAGEDAAIFGADSLVAQDDHADTIWEPGKTQIVYLGVENKGNLDLKYNIALNVVDGGLIGSLEYAIVDGAKYGDLTTTDWAALKANAQTGDVVAGTTVAAPNGAIKANAEPDYFALAVHMKEDAGNDYMDKDITIDVTVLATQLTAEEDSFGDQYDADADYIASVADAAALDAALKIGGNIELTGDINLDEPLEVGAGVNATINLNGKTINAASNGYALFNQEGGTLTIGDDADEGVVEGVVYTGAESSTIVNAGTYNAATGGRYVFLNESGTLTINKATINGGSSYPLYGYGAGHKIIINDATVNGTFGCICAYSSGDIEINDGEFYMTGVQSTTSHIAYIYGSTTMTINGGTFKKIGDINMSGTGGGGIGSAGTAVITINDGVFEGDYRDLYVWSTTSKIIVKGGTYAFDPTSEGAKIAEGYNAVKNSDGTWTVS